MPERQQQLAHLESLGDATQFAPQMHALIPKCPLRENFSQPEVLLLAHFMEVYRAAPGAEIIREGDGGDFMLMLLEGRIEVHKRDRWNTPQLLASVESGRTLGEMSMIDGEPRFATCIAVEPTTFAVLSRDAMVRIILEEPSHMSEVFQCQDCRKLLSLVQLMRSRLIQQFHLLIAPY
jgi:CRP-like cAMP-binding protein